ncbi:MAG TPA: class I SAM-dependent methyltransferase [Bryobacteraceae bacterium]|nr:class I SAM-dependent methyltransferase [Bryobacteraceae bacterium]
MSQSKQLLGDAAAVGLHYDRYVDAESARLEQFCPVEYAITLQYLGRFVPERCRVAEIGVGAGHYSEFLARRGCRVDLVDVSERLLEAAQERLTAAGLAESIAKVHHASATELPLADASLDAVLLLGPLYHLRDLRERQKAVQEAGRVLKPGGVVAAAGINRIAFLRDMFRSPDPFSATFFGEEFAEAHRTSQPDPSQQGFMAQFLATGTLDPQHAPPIGYAHLTTISEFRELLTAGFEEVLLAGTESFTAPWQDQWKSKSAGEIASWLDIVEATGTTIEGLAYSDHFLFIGRRAA